MLSKKVKAFLIMCTLSTTIWMMGCSNGSTESESASKSDSKTTVSVDSTSVTATPEPTKEALKTIGQKDNQGYAVVLKNSTNKDITGISIKKIEETDFPKNLISDGDVYLNGESRELYYKEPEQTEASQITSSSTEAILTPGFDIQLHFSDNSVAVLHAFPFEDIKEGEICLENDCAYIKYESVSSKQSIETKEAELNIKVQEQTAAQAAVVSVNPKLGQLLIEF